MIELFFVITIIAVLIALLLPAIQSSREIARRTQCAKNLMQIGLALGNYASTHKVFPPGVVNDKGPISGLPVGYHYGWAVQILPFLELSNLYRQFDFSQSVYAERNQTARDHRINVFLCPSDGRPGLMSYAACHHDIEAPIAADNHGVFFLNSHVSLADINDGPAYTILVGEFTGGTPVAGLGRRHEGVAPQHGLAHQHARPVPRSDDARDAHLHAGIPTALIWPRWKAMIKDGQIPASYVGGFSSHHQGTANFLFGDGSVRNLSERIEPHVYRSLGHRADGNLISGDEF